jgi:thiamine biosynthesis lipoprotein
MRAIMASVIITSVLLVGCRSDVPDRERVRITGSTMGTFYTVKVTELPRGLDIDDLEGNIDKILESVNDQMSTYRQDSELSRLNSSPSTAWVDVSPEMMTVMTEAVYISRLTHGAFDVTVGPLVNLWGFGPQPMTEKVPTDEAIREALAKTGYRHIKIRAMPPAVKKDLAELYIDLSGIAKGYAVDKIADYLESLGISNYLVEVGGEMRGKGLNARGLPWIIAIEKPVSGERAVERLIHMEDKGLATSGDYRNYFEINGQRFSHTINPETGRPITHKLASVTVISSSSMRADALATALMVLGPEQGFAFATRENLAAFFIVKGPHGFLEKNTDPFKRYLVN